MLIIKRKAGETIDIGSNVQINILKVGAGHVKIGVEAPSEVRVMRGEIRKPDEEEA